MEALFESGRIAELVVALIALEAVALFVLRRLGVWGAPLSQVAPTLISGAALAFALRGALTDAAWIWVAAPLTVALVAHVVDLIIRSRA